MHKTLSLSSDRADYHAIIIETDAYTINDPDDTLFEDFIELGKRIMKENPLFKLKWVCRNTNLISGTFIS